MLKNQKNQVFGFPDKIGIQGFNPNRTIVHSESTQLVQEKPIFNGTGLSKQALKSDSSGNVELEQVKNLKRFVNRMSGGSCLQSFVESHAMSYRNDVTT